MRKLSLAFGLIASLFATSAYADFTGKNAAGTMMTFKNAGDCTAVVCVPVMNPVDSTGANFGVTANPFFVTIGSGKVVSGAIAAGAIVDGADVAEGTTSDAASTAGGTGTLSAKIRLMTTQLGTLNTTLGSPFQAGASIGNTAFIANAGTNLNTSEIGRAHV